MGMDPDDTGFSVDGGGSLLCAEVFYLGVGCWVLGVGCWVAAPDYVKQSSNALTSI
jgi:hypothetical protein